MVGVYCYLLGRALPPLRSEPVTFLLLPMTASSALVSLTLHPVLQRQHRRASQAVTLYAGFVLCVIVYGCYLWLAIPDGTPWLILLAVVAGHLYGLPLYGAVLVTYLLLDHRPQAGNGPQ